MSSFSASPEIHSKIRFKQRMAARKRANLETERKSKLITKLQTKKRQEHRNSTRQRLKDIQNERQRLHNILHDENRLPIVNSTMKTTTIPSISKLPYLKTKNNFKTNTNTNPKLRKSMRRTRSSTLRFTSSAKELARRPVELSSPGNHRNYKRVRNLGRGSFGAVSAAKNLDDGKIYAIKAIAYRGLHSIEQDVDRKRALKEVRALRQLSDHPCIVGLRDAFESSCKRKLFIVAEYCESGSLHDRLNAARRSVERNGYLSGKLESKLISSWIFQLLCAVEHLHSRNTLHRDIKPANIFLCAGATQIKLGDFGLVDVLENSMDIKKNNVGTPTYNMTPELLKTGGVSKPADIWSIGAVLHECLTLQQPYKQKGKGVASIVELGASILNDSIDTNERLDNYPNSLRHISSHQCCMAKDPNVRPTASKLLETNFMLKAMRLFLSTNHIKKPSRDLIMLVKSKLLVGEAGKM